MSKKTLISWCDSTHNFWQGCTKVSAGCTNCYAEARDKRFAGGAHWGNGSPRVRSKDFDAPLKWNKKPWICDECGLEHAVPGQICMTPDCTCETRHRRRVFSLSLGDWLDDEVPIEWLADMLNMIWRCPNLDFLLLTKRLENWRARITAAIETMHCDPLDVGDKIDMWLNGHAPRNIWLGVSVENQAEADKRIPLLLNIPARVRFVSVEPMLGPVDLVHWLIQGQAGGIDWAIFGGESGPGARPCNVAWIRDGLMQGEVAGAAVFVKQLGGNVACAHCGSGKATCIGRYESMELDMPACDECCGHGCEDGYCVPLRDKKGGDWSEWPEDLRVRGFPTV